MSDQKIQQLQNQNGQNCSQNESNCFSESDSDLFMNLAPTSKTNSTYLNKQQNDKIKVAKMKRLIGQFPVDKKNDSVNKNKDKRKNKSAKMYSIKTVDYRSEEDQQQQSQNKILQNYQNRDRSREKKLRKNNSKQQIISKSQIKGYKTEVQAAFSKVQKMEIKQNQSLNSNRHIQKQSMEKVTSIKDSKYAQMEKHLYMPIEQLPMITKSIEQVKEQRREKKRQDRMLQKKYKEYKVGKIKDQISNSVFNGIEDYFM